MDLLLHPVTFICFGILVGIFSGVMGLGGGAVMIPVMVFVFGLTQVKAHGTSLAVMVPPVALLGAIHYWRHGNVDLRMALFVAAGVAMGTLLGALVANRLPVEMLRLVFGMVLIYVAAYTVFGRDNLQRGTVIAAVMVIIALAIFAATRWYDARTAPPSPPTSMSPGP